MLEKLRPAVCVLMLHECDFNLWIYIATMVYRAELNVTALVLPHAEAVDACESDSHDFASHSLCPAHSWDGPEICKYYVLRHSAVVTDMISKMANNLTCT